LGIQLKVLEDIFSPIARWPRLRWTFVHRSELEADMTNERRYMVHRIAVIERYFRLLSFPPVVPSSLEALY
jgi:hypothetical protein